MGIRSGDASPPTQKSRFAQDINTIRFWNPNHSSDTRPDFDNKSLPGIRMMDGRDLSSIHQLADSIRTLEVARLLSRKRTSLEASATLRRLEILSILYPIVGSNLIFQTPVAEVTFSNTMDTPIVRVDITLVLGSKHGDKTPPLYLSKSFESPLHPGSKGSLGFPVPLPDFFTNRNELVIESEIVKITGLDGKIVAENNFLDRDEESLRMLQEQLRRK